MRDWQRRLWQRGGPSSLGLRLVSALLTPAEWAYRLSIAGRTWAYERGLFGSTTPPIPTLGIGNLTVGGAGKTPIAAWFAGRFAEEVSRAAVVLRGYGGDEVEVHRLLNPSVPVIVSPRRAEGVRAAQAEGAAVAILDDAFQHRAIRAHAHVVLIAAEDWEKRPRLLPRGRWREPPAALGRATLVAVTRKVASASEATKLVGVLADSWPGSARAQAYLGLAGLARFDARRQLLGELRALAGFRSVLALAGVARPELVRAQLDAAGVPIANWRSFPDHHRYAEGEINWIARQARDGPIVTTLKDAVKLAPALPPECEIWVPLQQVVWEAGQQEIESLIGDLLAASTAGGRQT